jgi:hypothetical protein
MGKKKWIQSLVRNTQGLIFTERPRCRWEDIKMDIEGRG